jgi:hypothetical protein
MGLVISAAARLGIEIRLVSPPKVRGLLGLPREGALEDHIATVFPNPQRPYWAITTLCALQGPSMRCSRTTRSTICVIEETVLREWARLIRPGGRVLYTEALVLTGPVSNDEVRRRTFMGFFVLTPAGANERAIEEAGLVL